MTDLRLDDNFDVVVTTDLETVEELEELEQKFALTITDYFFNKIGDRNSSNVVRKLNLAAQRSAQDTEGIDSIQTVEVNKQEGDSLWLDIKYNHSEEFEFEVI